MFIQPAPDGDSTERIREQTRKAQGFVMNLSHFWAWRPEVFEGFAALRSQLTSTSALTKRDQALMVCSMAGGIGDAYCSLAWGRTLSGEAGADAAAAVIAGADCESLTPRDRAIVNWARKVASDPNGTTAEDVEQLRLAGLGDREIFEATAFIAFRLAFSTVNDALGLPPDPELVELAPPQVRTAVSFGRTPRRLTLRRPPARSAAACGGC